MKKLLAALIVSGAIFTIVIMRVWAQNAAPGLDLTVSPPVFDLSANPGDKVLQKFRIRNNQNKPVPLTIEARRLISDPATGNPEPESEKRGEELSWVSFDPPNFTAPPREWKDVTFTIDIPKTAAFGYYYVFRIAQTNVPEQKTTGAAVKGELLVVVLLNVRSEGAISKATLANFAPEKSVYEYLPVNFNVVLENRGNVHVKPRGNIFITRGGNKEIAILDVNDATGSILPGGKRTFVSSWNDGFIVNEPVVEDGQFKTDQNGKPVTRLTINWNKLTSFRIGPYTAHLLLVYDDGKRDQTIEGETTFMVLPYTVIGILLVSLVVLFFILRFLLGLYVKAQIRKATQK